LSTQEQKQKCPDTFPLSKIILPPSYNYIGVFLTLACNLSCSYCINVQHGLTREDLIRANKTKQKQKIPTLTKEDWIQGLSRIQTRDDLPLSLQGGEPTLHPRFYEIVRGLHNHMDLLTNGLFDLDEFRDKIPTSKFKRKAKYASIRISYHPEQMDLQRTIARTKYLQELGYQVGVWSVKTPAGSKEDWDRIEKEFKYEDIDFRYKELLGEYNGKIHGTLKYENSVGSSILRNCRCKPSELLIGPNGCIYRCHSDLYAQREEVGHILQENIHLKEGFLPCSNFGSCSACDVKIKTNRFQEYGHTSVEIKDITNKEVSITNKEEGDGITSTTRC
jgi:sulfatase maturation enzyme AslB (radical SAM superfamily)